MAKKQIRSLVEFFVRETLWESSDDAEMAQTKIDPNALPPGKDWLCWTRRASDSRAPAGTLIWNKEIFDSILSGFRISESANPSAYKSILHKAERFIANDRYDRLFESAGTEEIKDSMPLNKLLKAIAIAESELDPGAGRGGGTGLMQLTPPALEQIKKITKEAGDPVFDVDPRNPTQSVEGAAMYIKWLAGLSQDLTHLLNAYNSGVGTVANIKSGKLKKDGKPYKLNDDLYAYKIGALYQLMRIYEIEKSNGDSEQFAGLKTDMSG